jgi:three-Cys-motif partner protein
MTFKFDVIGYWSEFKHEIIRDYASVYSQILSSRTNPSFEHMYIDAFAGAGIHISKATGEYVPGSPQIALNTIPPFKQYYFIDINRLKIDELTRITLQRKDVHLFTGDSNKILLEKVFPMVLFEKYKRGLCLLDPYGLHLKWDVIQKAGQMRSIDMFLNFPVGDMNRNVLWKDPEGVDPADIKRMNDFWGDDSWNNVAYSTNKNLFGWKLKEDNETVALAFKERLKNAAGFKFVSEPLPMRNSKHAIIYYLYFASQQIIADNIIKSIFDKYRSKMEA